MSGLLVTGLKRKLTPLMDKISACWQGFSGLSRLPRTGQGPHDLRHGAPAGGTGGNNALLERLRADSRSIPRRVPRIARPAAYEAVASKASTPVDPQPLVQREPVEAEPVLPHLPAGVAAKLQALLKGRQANPRRMKRYSYGRKAQFRMKLLLSACRKSPPTAPVSTRSEPRSKRAGRHSSASACSPC